MNLYKIKYQYDSRLASFVEAENIKDALDVLSMWSEGDISNCVEYVELVSPHTVMSRERYEKEQKEDE